jgi:hypothetical protein
VRPSGVVSAIAESPHTSSPEAGTQSGRLIDDGLQQVLHGHLRALTIQSSDQRQGEDSVPQLDDRRGELGDFALLAHDDGFTALLELFEGQQAWLIQEQRDLPNQGDELRGFQTGPLQHPEQHLLE